MTTIEHIQAPDGPIFDENAPPPPARDMPGKKSPWTQDDVKNAIDALERTGYVAFRAQNKGKAAKLAKSLSSGVMRSQWWTAKLGERLPRFTSARAREIDGQWWGYVVVTSSYVNAAGSEADEDGQPLRAPRRRNRRASA